MNIELRDLSYSYKPGARVLNGVNLHVAAGASVAVLGASGSGKSTLLKLVAGLLEHRDGAMSGDIRFDGASIVGGGQALSSLKQKGKIGYLFQLPLLLNHFTVWQNICFPSEVLGTLDEARIQRLADLVGLSDHLQKFPKELSGGMRTRVALARMFSTDPELLLLDEPFSSLDVVRRSDLYAELSRLRARSRSTTILVTHDIFEAIVFSNALCVMNLSGSAFHYTVENWRPGRTYEEVVRENFSCFTNISEIIKSGA